MAARKAGRGGARKSAGRPTMGNGAFDASLSIPLPKKTKQKIRQAAGREPMAAWARAALEEAADRELAKRKKKGGA